MMASSGNWLATVSISMFAAHSRGIRLVTPLSITQSLMPKISGSLEEIITMPTPSRIISSINIKLSLCIDINATRGFVQNQHLWLGQYPFCQDYLLLVAAA